MELILATGPGEGWQWEEQEGEEEGQALPRREGIDALKSKKIILFPSLFFQNFIFSSGKVKIFPFSLLRFIFFLIKHQDQIIKKLPWPWGGGLALANRKIYTPVNENCWILPLLASLSPNLITVPPPPLCTL